MISSTFVPGILKHYEKQPVRTADKSVKTPGLFECFALLVDKNL